MKLQTLVMAIILVGLLCVASALWSCGASLVPSETGDTAVASGGGITVHTLLKAYPPDCQRNNAAYRQCHRRANCLRDRLAA